ncbi:MAG: hypothetical protein WBP47_23440 [Candidatus Promineifilaceae bacterium]
MTGGFGEMTGGFGEVTGGFGVMTGGFGEVTGGFGEVTGGFGVMTGAEAPVYKTTPGKPGFGGTLVILSAAKIPFAFEMLHFVQHGHA